ncbi:MULTISPECIES: glycogen/starch/alpha-glucan phosphorylase [unclassified Thermosynechococcus]|uniref:glycogen/starch/alpha-glucan phosphorylase n=1 Tax=unclassified Thermosynechococcus TaxID=2622553 RepID=UPI00197E6F14|nr:MULTISPECIES: glycogen/starch/alpha-glucan phosphorylase [unclassified Thermosynechococcus]QSF50145.1 glycogen/starch/alpha-glucan phosphorylase [Thermosynechococcus sp. TA-1]WNC23259.1 glycogen/starch/alpha-glucan phosphorylase [Thermosynechococcus sp. PP22]WNC30960.1 glycogen/starch/alpha-glucan phosphorylase [Thermosynechococcus sp. PKX82]WNC33497.1 glycogen/starch/alpha-glucan phosphorylase [Thermosynechococcus sp. PKX95]WNC36019.1 glycogen/starch/alpha-glucan phosphorylase [Thermosynec
MNNSATPNGHPVHSVSHTNPTANDEHCDLYIESDRTGMTVQTLKRAFVDNLHYIQGKDAMFATPYDYFMALAYTVRDRLLHRRIKTAQTYFEQDAKVVYYLSAEFLIGRLLLNNLINVGLYEQTKQAMTDFGLDLNELMDREPEPGLGNGGLGRLAACFLDSLATLEIPAVGYGIRYEYGIFEQIITNGWQHEVPDNWLRFGNPWEIARPDYNVEVKFGGHTEAYTDVQGHYRVRWIPSTTVLGTPYDTPIPGYGKNTVNTLRLWSARAAQDFNLQVFNAGDYTQAVSEKTFSENISKVLYPNDNTPQGKELRLRQQYFFVSCSLQDIIRLYLRRHTSFDAFPDKVAIQLNDTHPAIGVAELMRLLVDEYQLPWEKAWDITQRTFAYTNHTLLAEALERWSVELFAQLLPRHLEIIYEINYRFLNEIRQRYPGNIARLARMSLIEEGHPKQVRMAHLACVGSHTVNGVAELHTELIKQELMRDFYEMYPNKFQNKTNGITPRRWLLMSNPRLASLITETLKSDRWITHLEDLRGLEPYATDPAFQAKWQQIKQANKERLAEYIWRHNQIEVDPYSLFDIQVKRIHEYKRQHLAVLHIITLYEQIKANPSIDIQPRTFIFGGKAAPGYFMAKMIIKLINAVGDMVNHDRDVNGRLRVVFLSNYSVSLGEMTYPAADLSEQISTAGKEASGTGNMKFALNGALTIGTLDGANVEIRQEVGAENFFLFGLTAQEVMSLKAEGYNPCEYYNSNPMLKKVIDSLISDYFNPREPGLFEPIVSSLLNEDPYMLLADYQSYVDCQQRVAQAFREKSHWTQMSILNVARMGKFSSDRTIAEYCKDIWHVKPVPVSLDTCRPAFRPSRISQASSL